MTYSELSMSFHLQVKTFIKNIKMETICFKGTVEGKKYCRTARI